MNVLQRLAHARALDRIDGGSRRDADTRERGGLGEPGQRRRSTSPDQLAPAPRAPGFECRQLSIPASGPRPELLGGCLSALAFPPSSRLAQDLACLGASETQRPAVLDLESTGLAGAAVPFVIGVAWPQGARVEVWQWVLSRVGAEAEMLAAVLSALRERGAGPLMSFNGSSFDLPLLRLRAQRHGLDASVLAGDHVDVLHPARRVYRGEFDDCRLATLERRVLGVRRRGDIDGAEIPQVFWDLVGGRGAGRDDEQGARARARLDAVCEHNLVDILSLPALASHLAEQLRAPAKLGRARRAARHWLGLGAVGHARRVLSTWVEPGFLRPPRTRGSQWRAAALELAVLERRAGDRSAAARLWEAAWRDDPGCPAASEAWAKHLEHGLGDHARALEVARGSRLTCPQRIARLERRAAAELERPDSASGPVAGVEPGRPASVETPAMVEAPVAVETPPARPEPPPRRPAKPGTSLLHAAEDERGPRLRYRLLV